MKSLLFLRLKVVNLVNFIGPSILRETLKAKQLGNSWNSLVSRVLLPLPEGPLITIDWEAIDERCLQNPESKPDTWLP